MGEPDSDGANATFFAFVERRSAALGGRGEWQQSKEKNGNHGESNNKNNVRLCDGPVCEIETIEVPFPN